VSSFAICGALAELYVGIALSVGCATAQITPDTTLGRERSRVTSAGAVDQIRGGSTRGRNLFHSFEDFNVGNGRSAYFTNPTGIENILSRVTGANPSSILGTLGVSGGNANLFLMNPNGVIFGSTARLDIRGSFVGTTASAVRLGDTGLFSASEPATSNLLTVRPSALFFTALAAQNIINRSQAQSLSGETNSLGDSVRLQVPTGQTLALVGGNVLLEGGNLTAAGGRIELGSVTGAGTVSLSQSGNQWSLGYDQVDAFGDIRLEGEAFIDVSGAGGGNLQIQGAQLEMTQGSYIFADTLAAGDGEGVQVRTTEEITLRDGSRITADVIGSGTGGDLTIATRQLTVQDGARVSASTFGTGDSGTLSVTADVVKVIGESADGQFPSSLDAQTVGEGNAGDVQIATGQLTVQDGAQISAAGFGNGAGGTLKIKASKLVVLDNQAALIAESAVGAGVNIELQAQNLLLLRRDSGIFTNAVGTTTGSNIIIDTDLLVALENSDISANALKASEGRIIINAQGIFGTEFREHLTPQSDITTSSNLDSAIISVTSRIVELNTPDVALSSGTEVVQACAPGGTGTESEFVVTGRGGLPTNPTQVLSRDAIEVDWVTLTPKGEDGSTPAISTSPTAPESAPVVEAQGWVRDANGQVILTAQAPTATPGSSGIPSASCHGS